MMKKMMYVTMVTAMKRTTAQRMRRITYRTMGASLVVVPRRQDLRRLRS
jgi:hypothetical protein